MANFQEILKDFSGRNRVAGSKGEAAAFDFIKKYIKRNLKGNVLLQKYRILSWEETEKTELIIAGEKIDCRPIYYSPKGKVRGKLEFFGKDSLEEGNEFDVYCIKNGKNIAAFIYVSENFDEPFYYNRGAATYLMPEVIAGKSSKEKIEKSIGREAVLKIKSKFVAKTSHNLIHKIKNRKNKPKLVIGAHVDTVPGSKGVLDNASGVAALLVLSEKLEKENLPFDIWLAYFGAEENCMFGSKFFADTLNEQERQGIKYMVSVDGLGIGEKIEIFSENDYHPQFQESFKEIPDKIILADIEKVLDYSDHYYFKLLGIDSCFISGKADDFYFHNKEAGEIESVNWELCEKTIESVYNFIKNIQFKSPEVVFNRGRAKSHIWEKLKKYL